MTHLWLRAESKPNEERTALTPDFAKQLLHAGFDVTVEDSPQSAFDIDAYRTVGCAIESAHAWITRAPADAYILGLKELAAGDTPLHHRHIHFAHLYKEQSGWQLELKRFIDGGGELLDLEYLVDEHARRVAAFGYWAGFAGAALALLAWAGQKRGASPVLAPVKSRPSKDALVAEVQTAIQGCGRQPRMLVIGALGRSGKGAVQLCDEAGVDVTRWDLEETRKGGPFAEVLAFDLLLNCVFVQKMIPPFVTRDLLSSAERQLSLICDVSCDPYGEYNPLPIYDACTTFNAPIARRIDGPNPLDLIAIDHLPSLLPVESSQDFCSQLTPHLLQLPHDDQGVWQRARDVFLEKSAMTRQES